jgi:branched-chain amino acid transport system ATP-binding protein
MCRPSLLIIDELSFGLSAAAVRVALDALRAVIQEEHQPTVLIVDQDISVLRSIAKRGYFMEEGQIAAQGLLDELVELDLIQQLYFSQDTQASERGSDKIPGTRQYPDRQMREI